jgi:hypothetical protein
VQFVAENLFCRIAEGEVLNFHQVFFCTTDSQILIAFGVSTIPQILQRPICGIVLVMESQESVNLW